MSQRLAMILAVALTLVLGTGVYAARGRIAGTHSNPSSQVEVVNPTDTIGRQNPIIQSSTEAPSSTSVVQDSQQMSGENTGLSEENEQEGREVRAPGAKSSTAAEKTPTATATKSVKKNSSHQEEGEDD